MKYEFTLQGGVIVCRLAYAVFSVLMIAATGCVANGPKQVEITRAGPVPEEVETFLDNLDKLGSFDLEPISIEVKVFGFNGLMTKLLEKWGNDFVARYAPQSTFSMAKNEHFGPNQLLRLRLSNKKIVVFGFSNNDSVFGFICGRDAFLQLLNAWGIKVDLLVLFDDTWGSLWGSKIPENVKGVIHICTCRGGYAAGKPIACERLQSKETWSVSLRFSYLNHARVVLRKQDTGNPREEYARQLYTALILRALSL